MPCASCWTPKPRVAAASPARRPCCGRPASPGWSTKSQDGHGLVMLMGKGVGKTTLAAAVAVALAHRGHAVHLTTSDPAAHLMETLDGTLDHLSVSRIDPHEVTGATASRCCPPKALGSTRRAVPLLEETCARRAPRRSRCSRRSLG